MTELAAWFFVWIPKDIFISNLKSKDVVSFSLIISIFGLDDEMGPRKKKKKKLSKKKN